MKNRLRPQLPLLITLLCGAVHAQNFNRPVPVGFPAYEFEQLSSGYSGYFLTTTSMLNGKTGNRDMAILDADGYLAWFASDNTVRSGFEYHPEFQRFVYYQSGPQGVRFIEMDTSLNPVDTLAAPTGITFDGHEYTLTSNHHKIVFGVKDTVMDLSAYTFNGQQGLANENVIANTLYEFDENNQLLFSWTSTDHIHPTEFIDGFNYNPNAFDYLHFNAIEMDDDGNFLLSGRHTSTIYKVNRTTGAIMWRWGGSMSDFTLTSGTPFSGQHHIRKLGNGRYSMFNNNNPSGPSHAVEYTLDTAKMEYAEAWSYTHQPSTYTMAMGSHQHRSDDLHLINWGLIYRPAPSFTLIDANDQPMVNVYFRDSVAAYRSFAQDLDFTLPRPEISCDRPVGDLVLTAPTAASYLWSDGSTTQSITVTDTGTYMVWVPYGIGMIGSMPFQVDDLVGTCPVNGIEEAQDDRPELIEKLFDLTGREVKTPMPYQLYIGRTGSGKSRMIYGLPSSR
ncbi:MAG: aryl-sulfate sulfotransferase [Flavobacteriales bacterium]|nr:aryl-sulfate sulfotransferase [Flavobacteriales bacterium]MCB9448900.1 aryl-sulfate sulfotransferase [Flavobacteriales bacterium]